MSLYYELKRKLFPFNPDAPFPDYTPQFRLESRARTADSDSQSLAMRVADPLWMLGRQWQFGEFQAEDNGSPIQVSAFYRKEKADFYSLGNGIKRFPISGAPLEARVEAMPLMENNDPNKLDLKSKVRIGRRFERLVRKYLPNNAAQLLTGFRMAFSLSHQGDLDASSQRFFNLMKGKVVDGGNILRRIYARPANWINSTDNNIKKALNGVIVKELTEWYEQFYVQPAPQSAWDQHQLAHNFRLHHKAPTSDSQFTLYAPDYQSGRLDWYSFDTANIGNAGIANHTESKEGLFPLRASFPSMPDKRLFAFEDGKIDLTKMNIEPGELIKTMLLDFSLASGSDWYTVPLKMKLSELCWVEKIEVKDVFGVTTLIQNDGQTGAILNSDGLKVWDIFKIRDRNISQYKAQDHFLFLAPATSMRLESEPLEELLFLRDEYANMVWALERRVSNAMGKAVDGFDQHLELKGPFLSPSEDETRELPQFRLASTVPSNWIPFLPFHINGSNTDIELKRAVMMRNEDANDPSPVEPLTWLLASKDIETVREEAIPRAGVRVRVTNHRVRWTDGKTYLWRGRKVLAGRGEGNSGLRFDYLKESNKKLDV